MNKCKYDPDGNKFILNEGKESILPNLIWVVTDKCDNDCPFCFQPKTNTEFDYTMYNEYRDLFKELGVQKIDITGGEPLCHPNIKGICSNLKADNIGITITTNGVAQGDKLKWLLEERDSFSRILLSLNGYSEQVHDELCGTEGTYRATVDLVNALHKLSYKGIRVNTVVTKVLLEKNYLKLIDIMKMLRPSEWCLIQPHPENKKSTFDDYNISTSAFMAICDSIQKELRGTGINVLIRTINNYQGYWVLYPNGKIRKHVASETDLIEYNFNRSTLEVLKLHILDNLWLPT